MVLRYRDYCDELRDIMGDYDLPGHLDITFHMPMPKSWSQKKRVLMDGTPHEGKPDIDNLAKGFMDAFKKEDKHVYKLTAAKYWADTAAIDIREG